MPRVLGPAVSLTETLCQHGLHLFRVGSLGQEFTGLSILITFTPSPPLFVSEESSLFIFGEWRGRVEKSPALTQDASKYFHLARTSKLDFFLFSLSHSCFKQKRSSCLIVSWGEAGGSSREERNWSLSPECFLMHFSSWSRGHHSPGSPGCYRQVI